MTNLTEKIQYLLDKEAIQQIRFQWGEALDLKNWAQFEGLFTEVIETDFRVWGIEPQPVPKAYFVSMFAQGSFRHEDLKTQHIYSNFRIDIDGDNATSVCNFLGQHHILNFEGGEDYCLRGEYSDGLIRTDEGWKINRVSLKIFFQTGNIKIVS
jgi:hypothetical protein